MSMVLALALILGTVGAVDATQPATHSAGTPSRTCLDSAVGLLGFEECGGCCQITLTKGSGPGFISLWYDCLNDTGFWADLEDMPPQNIPCNLVIERNGYSMIVMNDPSRANCNPAAWCFVSCCDSLPEASCLFPSDFQVVDISVGEGCPCFIEAKQALAGGQTGGPGFLFHCTVCGT